MVKTQTGAGVSDGEVAAFDALTIGSGGTEDTVTLPTLRGALSAGSLLNKASDFPGATESCFKPFPQGRIDGTFTVQVLTPEEIAERVTADLTKLGAPAWLLPCTTAEIVSYQEQFKDFLVPGSRILMVDDKLDVIGTLYPILMAITGGYAAAYHHAEQNLEPIADFMIWFDAQTILQDLSLVGIQGTEVLNDVALRSPGTLTGKALIFFTGETGDASAIESIDVLHKKLTALSESLTHFSDAPFCMSVSEVIAKPFPFEKLLGAIKQRCSRAGLAGLVAEPPKNA